MTLTHRVSHTLSPHRFLSYRNGDTYSILCEIRSYIIPCTCDRAILQYTFHHNAQLATFTGNIRRRRAVGPACEQPATYLTDTSGLIPFHIGKVLSGINEVFEVLMGRPKGFAIMLDRRSHCVFPKEITFLIINESNECVVSSRTQNNLAFYWCGTAINAFVEA